jgi:hypothetical protein
MIIAYSTKIKDFCAQEILKNFFVWGIKKLIIEKRQRCYRCVWYFKDITTEIAREKFSSNC